MPTAPADRDVLVTALARVAGAALLVLMALIHLRLWTHFGYRHLPTIGKLFVLNYVAGFVLAAAVLAAPRRLLWLAAGAGAGMLAGTAVALVVFANVTLFGFHESTRAPYFGASLVVEGVGAAVLAVTAVREFVVRRPGQSGFYTSDRDGPSRRGGRPRQALRR